MPRNLLVVINCSLNLRFPIKAIMSHWLIIGGAALVQAPVDVEVDYPAFGD